MWDTRKPALCGFTMQLERRRLACPSCVPLDGLRRCSPRDAAKGRRDACAPTVNSSATWPVAFRARLYYDGRSTPPPMKKLCFIEPLENRIAPAATVGVAIPDLTPTAGSTGAVVDLSSAFTDPTTSGAAVSFTTDFGVIDVILYDNAVHTTTDNFLHYVTTGKYNNTIFHRSVENFVVQGGGYALSDLANHISTFGSVINQFGISNTRGTIAMAKLGGDPDSATSEYFFNAADNSSNLDSQNGGFTVFGRIVGRGLNVVDAINSLVTRDLSGFNSAFDNLPLKNYNPDPDHNPLTAPPVPLVSNTVLVKKVASMTVPITPVAGNPESVLHFSIIGNDRPDLLSATLAGSKLNLHFAPGVTGVANLKIRATDIDGTTADQNFDVKIEPDLTGTFGAVSLPATIVPGDVAKAQFVLKNQGAGLAAGPLRVEYYLSTDANIDSSDRLIGSTHTNNLLPGTSRTLTSFLDVPTDLSLAETDYQLLAKIIPNAGVTELSGANNNAAAPGVHALVNHFGAVNGRVNVALKFTESDGSISVLALPGGGTGMLELGASTRAVVIDGTTAASTFSFDTLFGDGRGGLTDITAHTTLGKVTLRGVELFGDVTLEAGVQNFSLLKSDTNEHLVSIGASPVAGQAAKLTFDRIENLRIDSAMPISAFAAQDWLDTGAADSLSAPSIAKLVTSGGNVTSGGTTTHFAGDFQADITLTGTNALSLGLASIGGSVNGVSWTDAGGAGSISAKAISNSILRFEKNVGLVSVGEIHGSSVLAGISSGIGANELPSVASDFTPDIKIQNFVVRGVTGVASPFTDSDIAAATIANITVRGVDTDNSGETFGIVARSIAFYNRLDSAGVVLEHFTNRTLPGAFDSAGDFVATIV